jgi:hypothetical protein
MTSEILEFDAFAYASALANCAVAGQGFYGWKAVLCGAVLLAPQRPKQNERVPGADISGREGRGHAVTGV